MEGSKVNIAYTVNFHGTKIWIKLNFILKCSYDREHKSSNISTLRTKINLSKSIELVIMACNIFHSRLPLF